MDRWGNPPVTTLEVVMWITEMGGPGPGRMWQVQGSLWRIGWLLYISCGTSSGASGKFLTWSFDLTVQVKPT